MSYQSHHFVAQQPTWTYSDFEHKVRQIATELTHRKTHSIAIWLTDSAKLACTLLAAWQAHTRVLFVPNFTPESIAWANEFADFWITDTEIELANAEQFDQFAETVCVAKFTQPLPLFDINNQTEIWLKTSGSTGKAKTIVKTAQEMWLSAEAIAQGLNYPKNNQITAISSVSSQHIYGLTVHIMMSLVLGWQLGRKQQFFPECIFAEAVKTQQAVIISSPAMLTRIDWQNTHLPAQIKSMISSGGALPEQTSTAIHHRLQRPIIEIYGSTETGPIAWRDSEKMWTIFPHSQVGQNENDELWIEAKWLQTREQTADMVEFYGQRFQLLGRSDRIVKIGDKRTSLISVENALLPHVYVEDCYIAKHPQQSRLCAWVELSLEGIETLREKGRRAVISTLRQYLTHNQERSVIPRFWRFTHKLPRNSQSKINKLAFNQICTERQTEPLWLHQQQTNTTYMATGKVPLDLIYLKDHFANFPLVPGVVELQWITDKIAQFFAQTVEIYRIDKLKFQRFLRPNDEFELHFKWEAQKQRMEFQLTVEQETCCSGFALIRDK